MPWPFGSKRSKKLDRIISMLEELMADLTPLRDEVEAIGNVVQSAIALLNGLSQQLRDALADDNPEAVLALADQLDATKDALAEAVAANTEPVSPTTEVLPVEPVPEGAPEGP